MTFKQLMLGIFLFFCVCPAILAKAENLRAVKDIMGDELRDVKVLPDGRVLKGYYVLNRHLSPIFNCEAGGFFSLSKGGFVGEDVKVDGYNLNGELVLNSGTVAPFASVYGHAQIFGWARIRDNAQVFDHAKVYGWATIAENAKVFGESSVHGWTWISGKSQVFGEAQVYGEARVNEAAKVGGSAKIYGQARASGNARLQGFTELNGKAWVDGAAFVTGKSIICGRSRVSQEAKITDSTVTAYATIIGSTHLYGHMHVGGRMLLKSTPVFSKFSKSTYIPDPFNYDEQSQDDCLDEDYSSVEKENSDELGDCSICHSDMQIMHNTDEKTIVAMRCGHLFHRQCVMPWLDNKSNCPQCRDVMNQGDERDEDPQIPSYHFVD